MLLACAQVALERTNDQDHVDAPPRQGGAAARTQPVAPTGSSSQMPRHASQSQPPPLTSSDLGREAFAAAQQVREISVCLSACFYGRHRNHPEPSQSPRGTLQMTADSGEGAECRLCVICAEDFMTISGADFRSVQRWRAKA
jgi:hypothetical protein